MGMGRGLGLEVENFGHKLENSGRDQDGGKITIVST